MSPSLASSMALRVRASASPSRSFSIASVALLRLPWGLPFLPILLPGANFPLAVILPFLDGAISHAASITTAGQPRRVTAWA